MIEPIMYIGIGFLVAGLLVIGAIPMVHARAVRLTQRRLEAMTPMSMAEIYADKDQLRAELGEKAAALLGAEAKVNSLSEELQGTKSELAAKTNALQETERKLADTAA